MGENRWKDRWKERHGDFAVPCIVSDRWIEFSAGGSTKLGAGDAMTIAIMTEANSAEPRKICELIITREDLIDVLDLIEKPG